MKRKIITMMLSAALAMLMAVPVCAEETQDMDVEIISAEADTGLVMGMEDEAEVDAPMQDESVGDSALSGTCGNSANWVLNGDTLTISGSGAMTDYSRDLRSPWYQNTGIKKVIIEEGITTVGDSAFDGCSGITSVDIPSGVTYIGSFSFYDCSSLTKITLPDGVTSIGGVAFYRCTGLTSVTVPASVTSMENDVFTGCTGLTTAGPIGGGYDYEFGWTTSIPSFAFDGCSGLTSVILPDTVTSIGSNAFVACRGLTQIDIPAGVTEIGVGAFTGCSGLTSVTIPSGVKSIEAFSDCSGLTNVELPSGLTQIGLDAFKNCTGLTGITIPAGIDEIGSRAFEGCSQLKSITIPNGTTQVGWGAFGSCPQITSVTIPSSMLVIGDYAFGYYDDYSKKIDGFKIYGTAGSAAEKYASDNGFEFVTITEDNKTAFNDVPTGKYYTDAVNWAVSKNITAGTGNNQFSPEKPCTREQVVTFLWRAMGSPEPSTSSSPFTDVQDSNKYYYKAVLWAVEKGITKGVNATTFGTGKTVTRADFVTFLYRSQGSPAASENTGFSDVNANAYYAKPIAWAASAGVTSGTGNGMFSPAAPCTRGQVVTFLYRDLK